MNRETFIELRNLLAELYPDLSSIQRILHDAGIDQVRVELNTKVIDTWHFILREAEKLDQTDRLLEVVKQEYGTNKKFQHTYSTYLRETEPTALKHQNDQSSKQSEVEKSVEQFWQRPAIVLSSLALVILLIVLWSQREWIERFLTFNGNASPTPTATVSTMQEDQRTAVAVAPLAVTPTATMTPDRTATEEANIAVEAKKSTQTAVVPTMTRTSTNTPPPTTTSTATVTETTTSIQTTTDITSTIVITANLRAGPDTTFAVMGISRAGQAVNVMARNADGAWYLLDNGFWIAALLVENPPSNLPLATETMVLSLRNQTIIKSPLIVTPIPLSNTSAAPIEQATVNINLKKIQQRGVIIAGVKFDAPPFGMIDTNGAISGFEIDLVREFAHRWLGNPDAVEFVQVTSSNRIDRLLHEDIDIIVATMSITPERDEQIDFSEIYYLDGQNILINTARIPLRGNDTERLQILNGAAIAAVQGSVAVTLIQQFALDYGIAINVVKFEQYEQAIQPLLDGRVDGLTADRGILTGLTQKHPELAIFLDQNFSQEPYGIGVYPGNVVLVEQINQTLQAMKADGTYDKIYMRWFLN